MNKGTNESGRTDGTDRGHASTLDESLKDLFRAAPMRKVQQSASEALRCPKKLASRSEFDLTCPFWRYLDEQYADAQSLELAAMKLVTVLNSMRYQRRAAVAIDRDGLRDLFKLEKNWPKGCGWRTNVGVDNNEYKTLWSMISKHQFLEVEHDGRDVDPESASVVALRLELCELIGITREERQAQIDETINWVIEGARKRVLKESVNGDEAPGAAKTAGPPEKPDTVESREEDGARGSRAEVRGSSFREEDPATDSPKSGCGYASAPNSCQNHPENMTVTDARSRLRVNLANPPRSGKGGVGYMECARQFWEDVKPYLLSREVPATKTPSMCLNEALSDVAAHFEPKLAKATGHKLSLLANYRQAYEDHLKTAVRQINVEYRRIVSYHNPIKVGEVLAADSCVFDIRNDQTYPGWTCSKRDGLFCLDKLEDGRFSVVHGPVSREAAKNWHDERLRRGQEALKDILSFGKSYTEPYPAGATVNRDEIQDGAFVHEIYFVRLKEVPLWVSVGSVDSVEYEPDMSTYTCSGQKFTLEEFENFRKSGRRSG